MTLMIKHIILFKLYQIWFFILRILPNHFVFYYYKKGKLGISKIAEIKRWDFGYTYDLIKKKCGLFLLS